MKVYIYTLQREITQIISDQLTAQGNLCFPFYEQSDISECIRNLKSIPDLMILDYMLFNHDIFNIYKYLEEQDMKIPTIFYNDPCLIRSTRSQHWKMVLEMTQTKYIAKDFSHYLPLFKSLEELIESDELKPYIPLLQPAQQIPDSMVKDAYTLQYLRENKDDCIYAFRERSKIPDNLFYLLSLLQKNKSFPLSLKEIILLYEKDNKHITEESLKVLLSKLRNYIRKDKECGFLIYKEKNSYRFLRYKV